MPTFSAAPGMTISERFRVETRLGTSPNADTWRGVDLTTGTPCVLKLLGGADLTNIDQLHAFERESRVLDGLAHPAIPKVLAATTDPRGVFVLALEAVDGLDLGTHLRAGPRLGDTDLLKVARDLLHVLDYLHTRTPPVFHRDIKPSNIVRRPDASAALVDFGAVCDGWRGEHTMAVGTLGYMAPEQLHGHVTPRSDLYALGATLLHLATGRTPSECIDPNRGTLAIPANAILQPHLQALIDACIRPAPSDRPVTARAALAILDAPSPPEPVVQLPAEPTLLAPPATRDLPWSFRLPAAPRDPASAELKPYYNEFWETHERKTSNASMLVPLIAFTGACFMYLGTEALELSVLIAVGVPFLWLLLPYIFFEDPVKERLNPKNPINQAFRRHPVLDAVVSQIVEAPPRHNRVQVTFDVFRPNEVRKCRRDFTLDFTRDWHVGDRLSGIFNLENVFIPTIGRGRARKPEPPPEPRIDP